MRRADLAGKWRPRVRNAEASLEMREAPVEPGRSLARKRAWTRIEVQSWGDAGQLQRSGHACLLKEPMGSGVGVEVRAHCSTQSRLAG